MVYNRHDTLRNRAVKFQAIRGILQAVIAHRKPDLKLVCRCRKDRLNFVTIPNEITAMNTLLITIRGALLGRH